MTAYIHVVLLANNNSQKNSEKFPNHAYNLQTESKYKFSKKKI